MIRQCLILIALLLIVASALATVVGFREASAQGVAPPVRAPTKALLTALGNPAESRAVRRLMRRALRTGDPAPQALAEALGHAGGCAALEGVTRLLKERTPEVRIAALASLERIGLRSAASADAVHRVAQRAEGGERTAAIQALGVVGDGRDVELLLACSRSDDVRERRAAFGALRRMADVPIPPVYARWAWHWRMLQTRARTELRTALDALEATPEGMKASSRREALARHAWVDIELVEEYLPRWLRSSDRAQRSNACWLVAELRLADHADAVRSCRNVARSGGPLAREADRAVRVLGLKQQRSR